MIKIYRCEDTIEDIFTGIYDAWASGVGHDNIRIKVKIKEQSENLELFAEYIDVVSDNEKANKVARSIENKISVQAYEMVLSASLAESVDKGDFIYRFLILGFYMGANVVNHLTHTAVIQIFELSRNVNNEVHHFLGFLRFSETKNHILFSKIKPKNDVIQLIAPHFSDRLQSENFVIYDEKRKTAVVHFSNQNWFYTNDSDLNLEILLDYSKNETDFRILWRSFFESISIKERENLNLQRNNFPKRFRSNIIEFQE